MARGAAVAGATDMYVLERNVRVPVVAAGIAQVLALVVHVFLVLTELVGAAEGAGAVGAGVDTSVEMGGMEVAP